MLPRDVEVKTFSRAVSGYRMQEVDDFLDEVSEGLRVLNEQLQQAMSANETLRSENQRLQQDAQAYNRTLDQAQRLAVLLEEDARRRAEEILAEAEQQKQAMLAEADSSLREKQDAVQALEARRVEMLQQMRAHAHELDAWAAACLGEEEEACTAEEAQQPVCPDEQQPAEAYLPQEAEAAAEEAAEETPLPPSPLDEMLSRVLAELDT